MKVKINKLNNNTLFPTRGSKKAAGHDLYACISEPVIIAPHTTILIGTGIGMEFDDGCGGFIFPRSGLSTKRNLTLANCVGVVDSDYRGEVKVALHNNGDIPQTIQPLERIAQIIFFHFIDVEFEEDELSETDRGNGGFGSTGTL